MSARFLRLGLSASLLGLLFVASGSGCGDDTSGTGGGGTGGAPPDGLCFQNPLGCDDGTVCAFDDEDGKSMTCLPAGPKKKGEACQNVAGTPECGEQLVCLQLKGDADGICTSFCDGPSDCGGSDECSEITTDGKRKFLACADTR